MSVARRRAGRGIGWRRAVAALAPVLLAALAMLAAGAQRSASEPAGAQELEEWLAQADRLARDGRVAEAVQAYQALLMRAESVVPGDVAGQSPSFSRVVGGRIGQLDPQAMRLYRALYDPQAEAIFRPAVAELDRAALTRVVAHYFHTSVGDRALDVLAGMQFDQARYAEAARAWQRVLDRTSPPSLARPLLLAKAAVAWHLAGVPRLRDGRLVELAEKFPDASAVLAGREQNVLAFTRAACAPAEDRP